jgi:hypothetical protein
MFSELILGAMGIVFIWFFAYVVFFLKETAK